MWLPPWSEQTDLFTSTEEPGGIRVWLIEEVAPLPGGSWTPDISECPSDGGVCTPVSLSEVLQRIGPGEPYWLSPRACAGILRRAERRGKTLPQALEEALRESAEPSLSRQPA
jgi:hypothetical protein